MEAIVIFFVIMSLMGGVSWFLEQMKKQQGQQPARPGQPRQESPLQSVLRMIEEAQDQAVEQQRAQERARQERILARQRPRPRPKPKPKQRVLQARPVEDHGGDLKKRHLKSKIADRRIGSLKQRHLPHLQHDIHAPGAHGTHDASRGERAPKIDRGQLFMDRLERLSPMQRAIVLKEVLDSPRSVQWIQKRQQA